MLANKFQQRKTAIEVALADRAVSSIAGASCRSPVAPHVEAVPDDLVIMGYVAGAWGLKGWLKVVPCTERTDGLAAYPQWWLMQQRACRLCTVEQSAEHGKGLVVKFCDIDDRQQAMRLKGAKIAVSRSLMPEVDASAQGYYWVDLIGIDVFNRCGEYLGVVDHFLETGSNDVMVVRSGSKERLLPFIATVIGHVDLSAKRIDVDWGIDF